MWSKGNPVGRNVNWCNHCEKCYEAFPQKLKMELLSDLAIPLLVTYLEGRKILIWKDACIAMFIAALYIS